MKNIESVALDFRQRFVFDELDVRGCIVRLDETCRNIQTTHYYPESLARILNQFALAAALLRDSIKLDGSLTMQLRTKGPIKLIMADCLADHRVRAIAEYDQESLTPNNVISLHDLDSSAVLAITITPEEGERYQSIVPIEHATLAECLRDYFERSEQLPSTFNLFADDKKGLGIALHALPAQKVTDNNETKNNFERLNVLLKTLTEDEALTLSSSEVLTRLFHEESCRLFEAHAVEFGCVCSREKSLDAIYSLGKEDLLDLIETEKNDGKDKLTVDCHFCFQRYEFGFDELLKNVQ